MTLRHLNSPGIIAVGLAVTAAVVFLAGQAVRAQASRCQEECDAMLDGCHWTCENNVDVLAACDGDEACLADCWASCEEPFLDCSYNASGCATLPNGSGCSAFVYSGYSNGDGWYVVFDPHQTTFSPRITCTTW